MTLNPLLCFGETPSFWIFDFSVAPYLLYYSYIPTIILSLLIGFFVLTKDNHSLKSRMFFFLIISFVLWVVNIIFEWLVSYIVLLMFSWQLIILFEIPIFIFAVLFTYAFLNKTEKLPNSYKIGSLVVYLLSALAVPTLYNMGDFNISVCEGAYGAVWNYVYGLEIFSIGFIAYLCLKNYFSKTSEIAKKQVLYYMSGMVCFLAIFIFSNVFAEISDNYQMNFFGPLGMTIFLALLTYLIVEYKAFNIKLIGAQALVWSLIILIGSQFFFIKSQINMILTGATLLVTMVLGYYLILGVKALQEANEQKSEFMSFASHEIRSPMTAVKGYASMMLEGSMGEINPKVKDSLQKIMISSNGVVNLIAQYLNKSKMELGQLGYTFIAFDMGKLIRETVQGLQVNAEQRGITLACKVDDRVFAVEADEGKIKEVIGNILDNSIKYTDKGSVTVSLSEKDGVVQVKIADTGVGIPKETIPHLFKKFSRADAKKVNILGTGLGLFLAKTFVDAHKGKIWVESEGESKGSTFFVELPAKQAVKEIK